MSNKDFKENIITIKDIDDISEFNSNFYSKEVTKYEFINCTFKKEFIFEYNQNIKTEFIFRKCTFEKEFEFNILNINADIVLDKTIHYNRIIFKGNFNNKIYINNIVMNNISNIEFLSHPDKVNTYEDIRLLNSTIRELSFNGININNLNICDMKNINELNICGVIIDSKLEVFNIDLIENLKLFNINFSEGSKILFENLIISYLDLENLTQDVKHMLFHNIEITQELILNKVGFNNTYFNDFDISKAVKKIEKTSFINSSLNSIYWGNIFKIEARQDIFRQLKFVYDSQGNHIEANNFYIMEMSKYQNNISSKNISEKVIFLFNNFVSGFGKSWIKPFAIYILLGFFFTLSIYNSDDEFFKLLVNSYNPIDKNIIENYSIYGLLYKIFSGLILYHLIIAFRRQTKR
ncbi:MAG: hypothetical protein U9Q30_09285 [Campylobacterota bacterium]|nr:hypothetical protein [Campylobacterota bacterium]